MAKESLTLHDNRIKIMIVGGMIPWHPPVGGSTIVPHQLAEALAKAGHQVEYVVFGFDDSRLDMEYAYPLYVRLPAGRVACRNALVLPLCQYLKTRSRLREYDIVFCEAQGAAFHALHKAVLGGRPRLAAAIYNSGIPRFWWQRRSFFEPYLYTALKLADLVVCPSDYSRANVSQAYSLDLSKTRALHGGVHESFLAQTPRAPGSGKFSLLFCGRLNGKRPFKRLDTLLQAMPHVLQKHRAELKIIGTGWRYEEYVALAHSLGIQQEVHFLGHVDHSELPARYASADLFVLPSRMENFPLVLLEAMASGLPVVATAVGGVPELVVHGETGLLVPPNDPLVLAQAINSLLDDPEGMRSMGARGRDTVRQRYTWDKVAERMTRYLREVL
jgi:glycosyltransferase involved in cell wall biosynthesis